MGIQIRKYPIAENIENGQLHPNETKPKCSAMQSQNLLWSVLEETDVIDTQPEDLTSI